MGQIQGTPSQLVPKVQAQAPTLAPKVERAVNAAKNVAERQISAVPEDMLTETYRQTVDIQEPATVDTHLQLAVDDSTGRVIGRIVDLDSGEVVKQIPSDEMLQLIAKTKELFGQLVNEKV